MEVHHHPHIEKKHFKEYFLEFLMIFLAVTLGFFAENIREHFADQKKEKQYLRSFVEDLTNDEANLPRLLRSIEHQQLHAADSLPLLLKNADTKTPANLIYVFFRKMIRQQGIKVFITDRTIEQAKNSGDLRLITNKRILDSLIDYYKQIEFTAYLQETLLEMKKVLMQNIRPVLNGFDYSELIDSTDHIFNPNKTLYLLAAAHPDINNCLMSISDIRGLSITIRNMILAIVDKAANIKKLINEKYRLESE
ncbi:MAG TPA: hypothetical protein VGI82_02480 [Chitinophagaceae bacterium]|jgi:hypothetical protein